MIATEAVDRIHTTADSHNRVIVVEVMGRDAGWIAYASGVAGGAHVILVPEKEIDIDHVCALLKYNYDHGKHYGVVVVAEGCHLPEVGQVIGIREGGLLRPCAPLRHRRGAGRVDRGEDRL
jgi:6-phosphofructokinase